MIIPLGVKQIDFYKQCKSKGIRITSRYTGVVFSLNGKRPYWMAKCNQDGVFKYLGRFDFDEMGELKAYEAYEKYMNEIGKTVNQKKIYKKNKKSLTTKIT